MDIVKMIRGVPGDIDHLNNLINYIGDDRKLNIGGNGVDYNFPYTVLDQMMAVKKYYGKEANCPLVQAIVSYDEPDLTMEQACQYTEQIAEYFDDKDYQTLWCTHAADHNCSQYHMHLLINPVGVSDGKMMNTSKENYEAFEQHVHEVTGHETDLKFGKDKRKTDKS